MKTSTEVSPFYNLYRDGAYEAIRELGFECVDYNMPFYSADKPRLEIYDTDLSKLEKQFLAEKRRIEEAGLQVGQTHSPFHIFTKDRKMLDCRIEEIKYSIIATAVLGAECTVVHPAQPCGFDPDWDIEYTRDVNYYLFERLIPAAEEYGVTIALENMPGAGVPAASPQCLIQYIDMMNSDAMAACLDTGHANAAGENIVMFAQKLGHRLRALHLNDNDGRMDEHYIPFLGTSNCWTEFMQTLKRIDYKGTLNLEAGSYITRFPQELQHKAAEMSFKVLKYLGGIMAEREEARS